MTFEQFREFVLKVMELRGLLAAMTALNCSYSIAVEIKNGRSECSGNVICYFTADRNKVVDHLQRIKKVIQEIEFFGRKVSVGVKVNQTATFEFL